jgi:hypothetical protein
MVDVLPFYIDIFPVTVAQYATFVDAGTDGYLRRENWTDDGWEWRQSERRLHPDGWDRQLLQPARPMMWVSWYEADAYARWCGKRLPTEAELELAARSDEHGHEHIEFCKGTVWEWCTDAFSEEEILPPPQPGALRIVCGRHRLTREWWRWGVGHPERVSPLLGFRCADKDKEEGRMSTQTDTSTSRVYTRGEVEDLLRSPESVDMDVVQRAREESAASLAALSQIRGTHPVPRLSDEEFRQLYDTLEGVEVVCECADGTLVLGVIGEDKLRPQLVSVHEQEEEMEERARTSIYEDPLLADRTIYVHTGHTTDGTITEIEECASPRNVARDVIAWWRHQGETNRYIAWMLTRPDVRGAIESIKDALREADEACAECGEPVPSQEDWEELTGILGDASWYDSPDRLPALAARVARWAQETIGREPQGVRVPPPEIVTSPEGRAAWTARLERLLTGRVPEDVVGALVHDIAAAAEWWWWHQCNWGVFRHPTETPGQYRLVLQTRWSDEDEWTRQGEIVSSGDIPDEILIAEATRMFLLARGWGDNILMLARGSNPLILFEVNQYGNVVPVVEFPGGDDSEDARERREGMQRALSEETARLLEGVPTA